MSALFDPIFSIRPGKLDLKLKVRLIRIWKVTGSGGSDACSSLEMILLDAHGDRIHATVTKDLIYRLQGVFVEGEVYNLFFLWVVPNIGSGLSSHHPYKLLFNTRSLVVLSESGYISKYGLAFTNSKQLLNLDEKYPFLVDVIGVIVSLSFEKDFNFHGVATNIVTLELCDLSGRFGCVLIGDLADEFQCLFSNACEGIPMVVLQFVKVTTYGVNLVVEGAAEASRILFNPPIAELQGFKHGMLTLFSDLTKYLHHRYLWKGPCKHVNFPGMYPRKTITLLRQSHEDGVVVVLGKIVKFIETEQWLYPSCKCGQILTLSGGTYRCSLCLTKEFTLIPRMRSKVLVEDEDGSDVFILFGDGLCSVDLEGTTLGLSFVKRKRRLHHHNYLESMLGKVLMFIVEGRRCQSIVDDECYRSISACGYGPGIDALVALGEDYTPVKRCFRPAFSPALKSGGMVFKGVNPPSNEGDVDRSVGGLVEGRCFFTEVDMARVRRSLLSQFEEVYVKEMVDDLID